MEWKFLTLRTRTDQFHLDELSNDEMEDIESEDKERLGDRSSCYDEVLKANQHKIKKVKERFRFFKVS